MTTNLLDYLKEKLSKKQHPTLSKVADVWLYMEKSFSHQVGDIFVLIQLTARVGQEMGALNAAIATRADDEGSMVAKALMENHVCGWAASVKTHTNIKLAHKVVHVTLQCEENEQ